MGTGLTGWKINTLATTAGDRPTTVGDTHISETGTLFSSPHIRGTKVPMLLEAPTHLRPQRADIGRGSRTSEAPMCQMARGSRTSDAPRCRCCSRLSYIRRTKVPVLLEALSHPTY
ncbi:hypothetical protein J1N35_007266 [Gossypium stocksii]|uniref:Uncharacterized protein n=1 Tax=Gossypium stocksii TaxID=47602 RepID=A0A9D3W762_9ROSI|nr:hypothetical protein J1N35_007266 [Gossypium stocksii]